MDHAFERGGTALACGIALSATAHVLGKTVPELADAPVLVVAITFSMLALPFWHAHLAGRALIRQIASALVLIAEVVLFGMLSDRSFPAGILSLVMFSAAHLLAHFSAPGAAQGGLVMLLGLAHIAVALAPGPISAVHLIAMLGVMPLALAGITRSRSADAALSTSAQSSRGETMTSLAGRLLLAIFLGILVAILALLTHQATNQFKGEKGEKPGDESTAQAGPGSENANEDSTPPEPSESPPGEDSNGDESKPDEAGDRGKELSVRTAGGNDKSDSQETESAPPSEPTPPTETGDGGVDPGFLEILDQILHHDPGRPQVSITELASGAITYSTETARSNWLLIAIAIASQILLGLFIISRSRARRARQRHRGDEAIQIGDYYMDRLERILARHGHPRPPHATAREFTRAVAKARGAALLPCCQIAELAYRSRYGGIPPTPTERANLEDQLKTITLVLNDAQSASAQRRS